MFQSRDVKRWQQGIKNDPNFRYQMASLGCLSACTFGNFLVPVLITAHIVNNLDLGNENESYESD